MSLDTMMVVDFLAQDNQADIFQDQVDKHGALLGKCDLYLKDARAQLLTIPFSPFKPFINWRERRKDDRLSAQMCTLYPALADSEKALRDLMMEITEHREKVRDVTEECYKQLLACIDFTHIQLSTSEPLVNGLRDLVDNISQETTNHKNMVLFNTAVVKQAMFEQKVMEKIPSWSRGSSGRGARFVRNRSGKLHMAAIRDEVDNVDVSYEPDNAEILMRLVKLRTSREVAMTSLSAALETKETLLNNLESCILSKNSIEDKVRIQPGSTWADNAEREAAFLKNNVGVSQNWYSENCHMVYLNADALVRKMDIYHNLMLHVNEFLQRVVELRENMADLKLDTHQSVDRGSSESSLPPSPSLSNKDSSPPSSSDSPNKVGEVMENTLERLSQWLSLVKPGSNPTSPKLGVEVDVSSEAPHGTEPKD